jgi:hypothetical protein
LGPIHFLKNIFKKIKLGKKSLHRGQIRGNVKPKSGGRDASYFLNGPKQAATGAGDARAHSGGGARRGAVRNNVRFDVNACLRARANHRSLLPFLLSTRQTGIANLEDTSEIKSSTASLPESHPPFGPLKR